MGDQGFSHLSFLFQNLKHLSAIHLDSLSLIDRVIIHLNLYDDHDMQLMWTQVT